MALILFIAIHWYSSLFFQSIFHHRYAAHRHFEMSPFWEKVFFVMCFITQGSSYISARAYGILHRVHHAHTDDENDPHSPHNTNGLPHLMLETRNNYFTIWEEKDNIDDKFKQNLPTWDTFDKFAHSWITRTAWAGIYFIIYWFLVPHWAFFMLLPFTILMGAFQGASVNWWAHKFGYSNFSLKDTSKNILPVDLIFWGEAYHNNHHRDPERLNNAVRWFEVDVGYWMLKFLDWANIIKLKPFHSRSKALK